MLGKRSISTFLLGGTAVAGLALSACGGGNGDGSSSGENASNGSGGTSGHAATVEVADTDLGKILVDSKDRTLYLFLKDRGRRVSAAATAPPPGRPSPRVELRPQGVEPSSRWSVRRRGPTESHRSRTTAIPSTASRETRRPATRPARDWWRSERPGTHSPRLVTRSPARHPARAAPAAEVATSWSCCPPDSRPRPDSSRHALAERDQHPARKAPVRMCRLVTTSSRGSGQEPKRQHDERWPSVTSRTCPDAARCASAPARAR
jgi:hypothetical protein